MHHVPDVQALPGLSPVTIIRMHKSVSDPAVTWIIAVVANQRMLRRVWAML